MPKSLPLGIEFFKEMIDRECYYVDKTMLIKDLIDSTTKVSLFTRPRRFGKTLTLNMIKTFYEQEIDDQGNIVDNRHYFEGLKIMDAGERYLKDMGQHPVIWMTLKSAKQPDYDAAIWMLKKQIREEFSRHRYVLGVLDDAEGFGKAVSRHLKGSISYYDSGEAFYHGFMLGILGGMEEYAISSNRETGGGRADLILKPLYEEDVSVIMEFKYVKNINELDAGCDAALQQIEDKNYMEVLTEDGY